jgi:hypothetical protein
MWGIGWAASGTTLHQRSGRVGLRFVTRLPATLPLAVARLLYLEPGERPTLPIGRGLVLPDQPLVAALEDLGLRLQPVRGQAPRRQTRLWPSRRASKTFRRTRGGRSRRSFPRA